MNDATTVTNANATRALGLTLPCPCCGEREAHIRLYLHDASFACGSCEAEFSRDDVRDLIARWTKVLNWVETMPGEF